MVESYKAFMKEKPDCDASLKKLTDLKKYIEVLRENENCRFSTIFKALQDLINIAMITILLTIKEDEQCLKVSPNP